MAEKKYIEREALPKKKERGFFLDDDFNAGWNACLNNIKSIPAADVRPVVRGRWEDVEVTYVADKTTLPFERISSMRCNQCNRYHMEIYYYGNPTEMAHYCPNCGADMRETEDEKA